MADLLVRLDESWQTILNKGADLVLTSGIVATDPQKHAMTRIPDSIRFSLDIRSQSPETLDQMTALLATEMRQVERDKEGALRARQADAGGGPALCDPKLVDALMAAMGRTGLEPFLMPSGGGHDAAVFAAAGVPSAMVFVRNRNGSPQIPTRRWTCRTFWPPSTSSTNSCWQGKASHDDADDQATRRLACPSARRGDDGGRDRLHRRPFRARNHHAEPRAARRHRRRCGCLPRPHHGSSPQGPRLHPADDAFI